MDELTQMSADPETRAAYDARVREMNRIYAGQNLRYKEGIEKGRAEERAKAEAEKIVIAKNLLMIGLSAEQVSQSTGISVERIEALK